MSSNSLAKKFDSFSLIRYTYPTIISMLFLSTYMLVDGMFIGRFIGETALTSVNFVMPMLNFLLALCLMLATGSNAIVGKLLGEKKDHKARQFFTLTYIVGVSTGVILSILFQIFTDQIVSLLGPNEELFPHVKTYATYLSYFASMAFMQFFTQSFFITAGMPNIGFAACAIGGVSNILLDYILIVELDLGLRGAAIATGSGLAIPGIFGAIYFAVNRNCPLHFVKPTFDYKNILRSLYNGSSEFVGNISSAITNWFFNATLLEIAGRDGVASISVIMYIQLVQIAIYMGFSFGISPIISFKYGQKDHEQLKKIMKTSFIFITIVSLVTISLSYIFARIAIGIFISPDSTAFNIAHRGLLIFSTAYIFMGFNIFMSSMFTAFSNGKISAFLSITRSLVFIIVSLIVLPLAFDLEGVWMAVPFAEFLAIILSVISFRYYKPKYNY